MMDKKEKTEHCSRHQKLLAKLNKLQKEYFQLKVMAQNSEKSPEDNGFSYDKLTIEHKDQNILYH